MNKRTALRNFLLEAFDPAGLRRFFLYNGYDEVVQSLPIGTGWAVSVDAVIDALTERKLIKPELIVLFHKERPNWTREIDEIAALWLVANTAAPQPTSQPRTPAIVQPPPPAFRWLDDRQRDAVYNVLTRMGLPFSTLATGIDPQYIGNLPGAPSKNAEILLALDQMNGLRNLDDGTVPLARFLTNALKFSTSLDAKAVLAWAFADMDRSESSDRTTTFQPTPLADLPLANPANMQLEIQLSATDQTQPAAYLTRGAAAIRSVARLLVHRYFDGNPSFSSNAPDYGRGTGWLIAPSLLITNYHVLAARTKAEPPASPSDLAIQVLHTTADFDFIEGHPTQHRESDFQLAAADPTLDFALLRSNIPFTRPPLRLGKTRLLRSPKQALSERVNLLQHPKGEPMRLGFRNNFVIRGDQAHLSYLTDTHGGSSGSPVFDDTWNVVALHRGTRTLIGGPVKLEGIPVRDENFGVQLLSILEWLATHHPALHAEITAAQLA